MSHERAGKSNDWYTPKFIFDALGVVFDLDVAAPSDGPLHVPCRNHLSFCSLTRPWSGFVWMNPPFGARNALGPWLAKFLAHGNGIALTPDRTSAPWFQEHGKKADRLLFMPKVRFIRPDGSEGKAPSNGTCLWASGDRAVDALKRCGLGLLSVPDHQLDSLPTRTSSPSAGEHILNPQPQHNA